MANVPRTNTSATAGGEGLLGQLFTYLQSLFGNASGGAPQVNATFPTYMNTGLSTMLPSLRKAPMSAIPGGGIDPAFGTESATSAVNLAGNPARSAVDQASIAEQQGIAGQNMQLSGNQLFNNQTMQQLIESLLGGTASSMAGMGTYPASLRGSALSTAASGTGTGGGGLLSFFGL
jgi:hypothetical protein